MRDKFWIKRRTISSDFLLVKSYSPNYKHVFSKRSIDVRRLKEEAIELQKRVQNVQLAESHLEELRRHYEAKMRQVVFWILMIFFIYSIHAECHCITGCRTIQERKSGSNLLNNLRTINDN
uniref:Uncharacterized protein n=1 Tax=Heterorhabditis bacteriophora TaxID=37862 RepID=A0A1I7WTG7_HETBA